MSNQLDIINDLYKSIDDGREGKNIGVSTGLPRLDDWIGGIQRNMYYLIFGGSGSGKSAIALYSFIYRPLKDGVKNYLVVYFSLELSAQSLLAKLLCLYIWEEYNVLISYKDLMSWNSPLNDWAYEYVCKARSWLESVMDHFIIYDKSLNRDVFYHALMEIVEERGNWAVSEDGRRKIYTPNNPDLITVAIVDHLSLVTPKSGSTKKEEMDAVSAYAITLRERTGMSFVILQQENRNSANMDRRKMDMTECSSEDLKDTSCSFNDCNVCIGIYDPLKHKIKTCRDYPIICDENIDGWEGLRSRMKGLCLIKNRSGESDKFDAVNFFGEIGLFQEMPKAKEITDWRPYLSLTANNSEASTTEKEEPRQAPLTDDITYNFEF